MRTGSKQKLKYVIILEILRQETDAYHPMQTNTLLKKLEEQGIECSRETLYSDIKALNENGFEIFCNRSSSNEYYIEDRGFDVPEIRILIDAAIRRRYLLRSSNRWCRNSSITSTTPPDLKRRW